MIKLTIYVVNWLIEKRYKCQWSLRLMVRWYNLLIISTAGNKHTILGFSFGSLMSSVNSSFAGRNFPLKWGFSSWFNTIAGNGFKCLNLPLEIGTRGVVNTRNRAVLTQLCHGVKVNKVSSVIKNCSKLALLGSYTIWNARYSQDWSGGGFLKPWRAPSSFPTQWPLPTYVFTLLDLCNWCSATALGEKSLSAVWTLIIPMTDTVAYALQFIEKCLLFTINLSTLSKCLSDNC